jgi:hypothetical protein
VVCWVLFVAARYRALLLVEMLLRVCSENDRAGKFLAASWDFASKLPLHMSDGVRLEMSGKIESLSTEVA